VHLLLSLAVLMSATAEAKKPKKNAEPPAPAPVAAPAPAPAPRIEKQAIGECGCSAYAPPGLTFEPPSKSPDGADVWTGSTFVDGWEFGVIAVKFADAGFGADVDLEALAEGYMEYLKGTLEITSAAGFGRGHTLESNPAAKGIIDFWKDAEGDEFAVKSWIDQKRLAVLFVAGPGAYPVPTVQQLFLDGFRFE
jgi:hypothetical protein